MSVMRKLRTVAIAAAYKVHKNRFKKGVWPAAAYDPKTEERIWKRPNMLQESLDDKLQEECAELIEACHLVETFGPKGPQEILYEAGDVTALAMMLADSNGALGTLAPTVVCLCGSTKYKEAFLEAQYIETMAGNIVLTVGFWHHVDKDKPPLLPAEKIGLDWLHKRKIDLCDEILVINVDDYVGDSTQSEIDYAEANGKKVRWFLPHDFKGRGIVPGKEELVIDNPLSSDDPFHSGDDTFPMG